MDKVTNTTPKTPQYETSVIVGADEFTVGFHKVNDDQMVAQASLGLTKVTITRGSDGKVRVDIDDMADEDVYVSINATPTTIDEVHISETPWHKKRNVKSK